MTCIVSMLRVPYRIVSLPKNPVFCLSISPFSQVPDNHWSFSHHHSLVFSRMSLAGILLCVAFSEWLLSVSYVLLSFLHVFVVFFLLLNNIPLHDVPQFTHLVTSKFCFFFFAVMNKTATKNLHAGFGVNISFNSFEWIPKRKIDGLYGKTIFSFVTVTQLCLTLCNPKDYTIHGILQARMLEWVAIPFSRGSSQPRDQTQVSCIAGGFLTSWATITNDCDDYQ